MSDINSLNDAIEKVSKMDFNEIMLNTHVKEWERAFNAKSKILDTIAIAREGGASDGMLSYLRENIELQRALG